MTAGQKRRSRFRRYRWLIVLALAVLVCAPVLLWQTVHWARYYALSGIRDASLHTLSLVVVNLRGELARFRALPRLIATDPAFKRLLSGAISPEDVQAANLSLEKTNRIMGALDIYVMNRGGLTLAASNWASRRPFVGQVFNYRPYFRDAMQGRLGRYFAIGTTSKERGYYFAYPVSDGPNRLGVLAVKVQVGHLERTWRGRNHEIVVTDRDGVIFLSSNPHWLFRTLSKLTKEARERIHSEQQYAGSELLPLTVEARKNGLERGDILRIRAEPSAPSDTPGAPPRSARQGQAHDYLVQTEHMFDAGWQVMILARTGRTNRYVTAALVIAGFGIASLFLISAYVVERRRRIYQQLALQQVAQATLEKRVRERTQDLQQANVQLRTEVAERKRAETGLRQAQEELVQASRLAALGQVSAGISHELNQPLAAIRSYADNARTFLERDRADAARSNLVDISDLTERMAGIIKHLRTYARKDTLESRPTPLIPVIREALSMLQHRLTRHDIRVTTDFPGTDVIVIGGDVRLQQVFVNLITNAIDAMTDSARRELSISVRQDEDDGHVTVTLHDSGQGVGNGDPERLFDPFFTTKEVGEGLGLGLSITYGIVTQFGGDIDATNAPEGGAVFTVRLCPTRLPQEEPV